MEVVVGVTVERKTVLTDLLFLVPPEVVLRIGQVPATRRLQTGGADEVEERP